MAAVWGEPEVLAEDDASNQRARRAVYAANSVLLALIAGYRRSCRALQPAFDSLCGVAGGKLENTG